MEQLNFNDSMRLNELEFEKNKHVFSVWYGLKKFAILKLVSSTSVAMNESVQNLVISAINVATVNTNW